MWDCFFVKGEGMSFSSSEEVRMVYDSGVVDLYVSVKVCFDGEVVDIIVGCALLTEIVSKDVDFLVYNRIFDKKFLVELIDVIYRRCGFKDMVFLVDSLCTWGYEYVICVGIFFSIKDLIIFFVKIVVLGEVQ